MSDKKPRDMSIDMSGFSDDQLRSMYQQSTAGVRRQGYDGSNDTTVDYTPSAEDAINASRAVTSDWEGGNWDQLRDSITSGYSEEDLIHKMRGAVNSEYMSRRDKKLAGMQAGIDANTNRKMPEVTAKPAPTEEQKSAGQAPKTTVDGINPRLGPKESDYGKDMPGWGDTEWNPEGGSKAPGEDDYNKMMASQAKSKAQSYSGSKVDYSFNAGGGGTANPPTSANSGGTASADVYGNVTPEAAAQGHADNLLSKYKYGAKQALK